MTKNMTPSLSHSDFVIHSCLGISSFVIEADMELFARLMDELNVTREQAEGAAGALLQLAQARLSQGDFVRVADTIPGISDIIGKAPRYEIPSRSELRAKLSRLLGGLGGLSPLVRPFARLSLQKPMIRRFVEVLLRFFRERGGPEIETLLSRVWR